MGKPTNDRQNDEQGDDSSKGRLADVYTGLKSCNPEPDPLQPIPWFPYRPKRLLPINLSLAAPQVHLMQPDHFRPFDEFVSQEKTKEDWNVDVWRQEALCAEIARKEAVVSVEECHDATEAYTKVSQKWL